MTMTNANWPSNSDGHWRRAREALERTLLNMEQGQALSADDIRSDLGLSQANFRSVYWQARNRITKLPLGSDGARVYLFRGGQIRRLTDAEASENGRDDANKGRRHVRRSLNRLNTVNTSNLDDEQTQKHRLYEAQMQTTLDALSPQKRAAALQRIPSNAVSAGDAMEMLRSIRPV
jgi:hypothetical protein